MKINRFKTAILGLSSLALATGFAGCENNYQFQQAEQVPAEQVPKQITQDYFARIAATSNSGVSSTSGDFNNDGNLDLVIGGVAGKGLGYSGYFYLYEGDGKGNFTLKPKTETKFEGEQK